MRGILIFLLLAGPRVARADGGVLEEAAIIMLDAGSDRASSAHAASALGSYLTARGVNALENSQLLTRLIGTPSPRSSPPDLVAIRALLAEAGRLEAYADDAAAEALRRQVLLAYESTLCPSEALTELAAQAVRDLAIGSYTTGDLPGAGAWAREGWRRFGRVQIDKNKLSPALQKLFESERLATERLPRSTLRVASDRDGVVHADGRTLAMSAPGVSFELPTGRYSVWVDHGAGCSLRYPVSLNEQARDALVEVRVDFDLDQRLELSDPITLRCLATCADDLLALVTRLEVSQVYGIRSLVDGGDLRVLLADAGKRSSHEVVLRAQGDLVPYVAGDFARFSPLYLVPFGVGQLAQERTLTGVSYLAAQAGLLSWHIVSRVGFLDARHAGDPKREEDLRQQANLSLGLLFGAMAVNVLEALVIGHLWGEGSANTSR